MIERGAVAVCLSRYPALLTFVFLVVLLLAGCSPEQTELNGKTMGTTYVIKYVAPGTAPSSDTIHAEIKKRLADVNNQMSTYIPTSEISRFNQSTAIDTPFPVSPGLASVVAESFRIHQRTDGAFDITVGPLVNLWGFGPEKKTLDRIPDAAELEARRALVGMDKLELRDNALLKRIPGLYVDLSAIAKGYGVDVVATYLESQGITDYMVDIGGEVRTSGTNVKKAIWRIAIEKPASGTQPQGMEAIVALDTVAMATSGSYRNFFEVMGQRFSHTIDPRTGHPITHGLVSISVIAKTCMEADGLATALNVLGPEAALDLAERHKIAVYLIVETPDGLQTRASSAFTPYLVK